MLICRKSAKGDDLSPRTDRQPQRGERRRRLGEGGPVFLTRRKPSAFAEQLLARDAAEPVTAYDELWFAGRPTA
jgi:hypothetical protein